MDTPFDPWALSDEQFARLMLAQSEANLKHLQATPDTPYVDLATAHDLVGYWSVRLHDATSGQIVGSGR